MRSTTRWQPATTTWNLGSILLLASAILSNVGCGSAELKSPAAQRLRGLAAVYMDYAAAKGNGPQNAEQLVGHLSRVPAFLLEGTPLSATQTLNALRSERDGELLVVCYGVGIALSSTPEPAVIAAEKLGKDGTRLVAFADGHVECLESAAAEALLTRRR